MVLIAEATAAQTVWSCCFRFLLHVAIRHGRRRQTGNEHINLNVSRIVKRLYSTPRTSIELYD
jgi:hypothetical protein